MVPKISFRDPRVRSCLRVLPPEAVRIALQRQTTTKEAIYACSEKCSHIFLVRHIAVNDMRRLRSAQCTVHPRKSGPSAPAPTKRGLSWGPLCSFARCSSLNRLRLSGVPFVFVTQNQMNPRGTMILALGSTVRKMEFYECCLPGHVEGEQASLLNVSGDVLWAVSFFFVSSCLAHPRAHVTQPKLVKIVYATSFCISCFLFSRHLSAGEVWSRDRRAY